MKFSKYIYKAVTPVMALFQKQHGLPFKQDYDNLRSTREESAASAGTAQSERQLHRNQSAVCASHNVPSDNTLPSAFAEHTAKFLVTGHHGMILPFHQVKYNPLPHSMPLINFSRCKPKNFSFLFQFHIGRKLRCLLILPTLLLSFFVSNAIP